MHDLWCTPCELGFSPMAAFGRFGMLAMDTAGGHRAWAGSR